MCSLHELTRERQLSKKLIILENHHFDSALVTVFTLPYPPSSILHPPSPFLMSHQRATRISAGSLSSNRASLEEAVVEARRLVDLEDVL